MSFNVKKYRIIDVSQWMHEFCFEGDQEFFTKGPFNRVAGKNPEFVYDFELCSQSGTHIQGAHYFNQNGQKIESYPLESFEGQAWLFDLAKKGVDTTKNDLMGLIGDIELKAKIVIFRTGNMDGIIKTGKVDNQQRPGLSVDAARYLVLEKQVKMIAIDSLGIESRSSKNYEVNTWLCKHQILILEGLVNLQSITRQQVFLEAFPLKIKDVEGTPCRAIIKEAL